MLLRNQDVMKINSIRMRTKSEGNQQNVLVIYPFKETAREIYTL